MSFSSFNFDKKLLDNVASLGFTEPTPIQVDAIPSVLGGRDVVGLAQTGTGKTAAFLLPIIQRLIQKRSRVGPRALVIAPTRELVDQIANAFRSFADGTGLRAVTLYGGVPIRSQIRKFEKGMDVAIACPGRLLDHLKRRSVRLSALEVVVLDEADHMFDIGFLPVLKEIRTYLPEQRQSLLFTATMPDEILRLAEEYVSDPVTVRASSASLPDTVAHKMYSVSDSHKSALLLELLRTFEQGSAIVFARTKRRVTKLGEVLEASGISAVSLQGNLSQNRRRAAIDGFRRGQYQVLVATDVAARGIDVSSVSHVVNFDMPDTVESYTHRTGRTGRARRTGTALSFATVSDGAIVRRIERQLKLSFSALPMPDGLPKDAAEKLDRPRSFRDRRRRGVSHDRSSSNHEGRRGKRSWGRDRRGGAARAQ